MQLKLIWYAELILNFCVDVEQNSGPIIEYKKFFNFSEKFKRSLSVADINFKNAIVGISENVLPADDKTSLWNVGPNTHELFRCNRSAKTKKAGGIMILSR